MQIADWLDRELAPRGVGVVLIAEHTCMTIRGVRKPGAKTVTSALRGALRDDPRHVRSCSALPAEEHAAWPLIETVMTTRGRGGGNNCAAMGVRWVPTRSCSGR